jgi:hypothetical protein
MSRQKIKQFMRKFDDVHPSRDQELKKSLFSGGRQEREREREQERERERERERQREKEREIEREREMERQREIEREREMEQERERVKEQEHEHEQEHEREIEKEQIEGTHIEHSEQHEEHKNSDTEHEEHKSKRGRKKKEDTEEVEKVDKRESVFVDEDEEPATEIDSDNPFTEINKQVFVKYLKSISFSTTADLVNSIYAIMSELVYSVFFKVLANKRDNSVTITLSDITDIMSNYVEDEDMPEDVFIPMKMFYTGINNICKDCKCTIKRDALIHLQLFTEYLLNKIVSNAALISKNARRNRVTGKDVILSHKLSLF